MKELTTKSNSAATIIVWIVFLIALVMLCSTFAFADGNSYIFDWNTFLSSYLDASVPNITPVPHPVFIQTDAQWQGQYNTQYTNGGLIAAMLRNPTAPYDGVYKDTLTNVLSYLNTSNYYLNFVMADFEGSVDVHNDITTMVSQVRSQSNLPAVSGAYIGNYGFTPQTTNYAYPWPPATPVDNSFYLSSGVNIAMPATYPYTVYVVHTWANQWGTDICPNAAHAMFWAPLERLSASKRDLPSSHLLIPWIAGAVQNPGYSAPIPTKTDCRSLLQHERLRGADGYYTLGKSENTNYTSNVDYRDDMYINGWGPLNGFFRCSGPNSILNLDTNKTGGVEWSGMRRGNRCQFIFSNYTTSPVSFELPSEIENLPDQSPVISAAPTDGGGNVIAGSHLLMEYVIGPMAYWRMNENSGSNIYDSMEGEHTGMAGSGCTWTTGKSGSALSFANGGTVTVSDSSALHLADNVSISMWFYPTAYSTGYATWPINKSSSSSDANFRFYFFGSQSGSNYKNIYFCANAGGVWQMVSPAYTINELNTWYHIVWTYSSTTGGKLYVNGVLQGNAIGGGQLAVNTQPVQIGSVNSTFPGVIDELKIYSSTLTGEEVFEEYASALNIRFSEGEGTTAADDSIYAHTGTVGSSCTWTTGKSGSALSFANGGTVTVPDSSALHLADNVSISMWFYPTAYSSGYATWPINKSSNSSDANFRFYFFGSQSGSNYKNIYFCANAGGVWQMVSPAYTINELNTWYHIVWTYSSTTGGKLYVNGVLQGNAIGGGQLAVNTQPVQIGSVNSTFPGVIDELKIYNCTLSDTDVNNLFVSY